MLEAAAEAGVKVPRPVAYLGELGGREAFAMERVEGETIGRRIVAQPAAGPADVQLADELAKIHAIPPERLPFLGGGDILERFEGELDSVGDPHPAIEYGLWWLREHRPAPLAGRRHATATSGSATSSSRSAGSSTCSTGSSRTSPTLARTSPGRSSARGASAPTSGDSEASARSSRTSSATRS